MVQLADRLSQLPPYLFAQLDAARTRAQEKGLDTVSMGIGDPDLPPPLWLRELLCEEVRKDENHRYPSYKGHPALHEACLRYLARRFSVTGLELPNVMTTIGSKEGIANLVTALVNPGDLILMPDPMYPVFGTMSRLLGAETVSLPLTPETAFMPDPRALLTPEQQARARVLFINYPHNPTGQLATLDYLQSLVEFANEHNIIIVSDIAYGEVFFDPGSPPPSVLQCSGALDCVIELHSFSKSFNMTGWRCGFAVGNAELIRGLHTVKSNVDSGCFNAIQLALARALDDPRCADHLDEMRALYKSRLEKVCTALEELGIRVHRPGASIFVWAELPDNAPRKADGQKDSLAWCAALLDQTGLVVGPGAGYGAQGEGFFRLSLSTPDSDIDKALGKLAQFVNS